VAISLTRARSAIGRGIAYVLGAGGWDPASDTPGSTLTPEVSKKHNGAARGSDCSGFLAWVIGRSRKTTIVPGMWGISTDSIYRDATTAQAVFERIDAPEAGCIACYPDHDGKQGHVVIVTDPAKRTILDCAYSRKGITEHPGTLFWATFKRLGDKSVFARVRG
jgi:hypothetical protein